MVDGPKAGSGSRLPRAFTGSNYYNVYLRAAAVGNHECYAGHASEHKRPGSFMVSSAISQYNYRYVHSAMIQGNWQS